MKIVKAYTRHYRDNDDRKAYVEWADGSRTEGEAELYYGLMVPRGAHMGAKSPKQAAPGSADCSALNCKLKPTGD
jgi:hypothetical protein